MFKGYSILETYNTKTQERRYYADGKRISEYRYELLKIQYPHADCFWSEHKGDVIRYHHWISNWKEERKAV